MTRQLHRMVLGGDTEARVPPCSAVIRGYRAKTHHAAIPAVYGRAFGDVPWPASWNQFDEFDADGAFVAEDAKSAGVVGFVLSFRRRDHGYISVVAVVPEHQRQGVGAALVRTAIRYLRGLGLSTIRIDAFTDATPAVNLYRRIGFRIETTVDDDEG